MQHAPAFSQDRIKTLQSIAVVRVAEIQNRAHGHNAIGIDRGMTAVIVLLDVLHIHRRGDAWPLI